MTGIELIRRMIRQQTVSLDVPVKNLHGAAPTAVSKVKVVKDQSWIQLAVTGGRLLGLEEFFAAYGADPTRVRQTVTATNGVTLVTAPAGMTSLLLGVITLQAQAAIGLAIAAAQSGEFAVYVDNSLVRRASGAIELPLTLSAGQHVIQLVATSLSFGVSVLGDVSVSASQVIPAAPVWNSVTTTYQDLAAGTATVRLSWFVDMQAGGWRILRRQLTYLNEIVTLTVPNYAGEFAVEITGDQTGAISVGQSLFAGAEEMGTVMAVSYDSTATRTSVRLRLAAGLSNTSSYWLNRYAAVGAFQELTRVRRTASAYTASWEDASVGTTGVYEYALQAFGLFDESVLSPLSAIQYIVAGDSTAPGDITLLTGYPKVVNNQVIVKFTPPSDADYAGTRTYYADVADSGTSTG